MHEESEPPKTDGAEEEGGTARTREALGLGERNKTINLGRQSDTDRDEARKWLPVYDEYAHERPKTRADCVGGERPCPWVGCRYNNYLDEKQNGPTAGRAIVFNFPNLEPDEVPADRSCTLDIADQGGTTLEDVALLTNLTRERVRQIQDKALRKLEEEPDIEQFTDGDEKKSEIRITGVQSSLRKPKPTQGPTEYSDDAYDISLGDGDAIEFLSEHPRAEELITARVFRIYMRESVERGFAQRKKTKRELEGLPDVPPAERFAETNIEDDLSVRHNRGMTHSKKKTSAKTRTIRKRAAAGGDEVHVTERQARVQTAYELLKAKLGGIPNNKQISEHLTSTNRPTTVEEVTRDRGVLVKMKLVEPAPRGRTTSDPTHKGPRPPKKTKRKGKRKKTSKVIEDGILFEYTAPNGERKQRTGAMLTKHPEKTAYPLAVAPVAASIQAQMNELHQQLGKLQKALDALA